MIKRILIKKDQMIFFFAQDCIKINIVIKNVIGSEDTSMHA